MRIRAPRWLLILEGLLLLCAVAVLAYQAAMRVAPLPVARVSEMRRARTPDPKAQILEYYEKYPDRYIRIFDDSWVYNPVSQTAFHSLGLRNTATVAYTGIEVRLTYESRDAKVLKRWTLKIPGGLAPLQIRELQRIEVRGIPSGTTRATAAVETALVVQSR